MLLLKEDDEDYCREERIQHVWCLGSSIILASMLVIVMWHASYVVEYQGNAGLELNPVGVVFDTLLPYSLHLALHFK